MANKSFKKISNLSKDELVTQVRELGSKVFDLRMKLKSGQLENTSSIWAARKDLARTKTKLRQLEISGGQ